MKRRPSAVKRLLAPFLTLLLAFTFTWASQAQASERSKDSEGPVPDYLILAKAAGASFMAKERLKALARQVPEADLQPADALLARGGLENTREALHLYRKAVELEPDDFEANWKCARALYRYSEEAQNTALENWEDFCRVYGKEGLRFGEKAVELEPERVEGHLYYGACVSKYAQGVGLVQAWKEGLKGKAQEAMERAYRIEKNFDGGAPMKALALFWYELPWPLRDYENALDYWEEYHASFPEDDEGLTSLARTLLKLNREDEAAALMRQADQSLLVLQQDED